MFHSQRIVMGNGIASTTAAARLVFKTDYFLERSCFLVR